MSIKKTTPKRIINYSKGKSLNVRLRGKLLSNNTISLFLDFYKGYSKDESGKIKTKRSLEYLKIYLIKNPANSKEREKNDENLKLAQEIRNRRESDILHKDEGLVAPYKKKSNFLDFFQAYIDNYQKKDVRMVKTAQKHFKDYVGEKYITPRQIDPVLIRGYRDYLLNKFNGETPNSIFARFKKVIRAATEDGLFSRNPAEGIVCKVPTGIPKAILTTDEIIMLSKTPCRNPEIKRAFLFCLNTGLRFVDVDDMYFKHISDGKIRKQQQKTGREVVVDLNDNAKKLLGEPGKPEEKVFNLPSLTGCLKTLKDWAGKAGINKNITWHSARHSFATILLMNNTDIRTVGSLMGHSILDHTQKYLHVVDELKKRAVNVLPQFEI